MLMTIEPEKKEQTEGNEEEQKQRIEGENAPQEPDYLPMGIARELASALLASLRLTRTSYLNSTGEFSCERVMYEHDLHAADRNSPSKVFGGLEQQIVTHAARLQAEVLDCVKNPDSPTLEAARQEVLKARHIYGEQFEVAVGAHREKVRAAAKTSLPYADRDWKPKAVPQQRKDLGDAILKLYYVPVDLAIYVNENYKFSGISYKVPEGMLSEIPRPSEIVIVVRNQRPQVDLEHTLRLNKEVMREPAHRALERSLKSLLADRAALFTLQELVKKHLLSQQRDSEQGSGTEHKGGIEGGEGTQAGEGYRGLP